jgi:transcriptional regulator with XRE-family HTH domain
MPRPSKHISPETLGGCIRAARENLHLSLADVANGHYSTSFISQIERNRIEPSQESLRYLAERLQIPLADLEVLARAHQEAENEEQRFQDFEALYHSAYVLLQEHRTCEALALLRDLHFAEVPDKLHWLLALLRGRCFFVQNQFQRAQQDLIYALNELPPYESLKSEQKQEAMLLHLHLAGTYRELQQFEVALQHYKMTLRMINSETPSGHVAEAHHGIAFIFYAQSRKLLHTQFMQHNEGRENEEVKNTKRGMLLREALVHAENARVLYRSVSDLALEAMITCFTALIRQELGDDSGVQDILQSLLANWFPIYRAMISTTTKEDLSQPEKKKLCIIATVISAASCGLAGYALEAGNLMQALTSAEQAVDASLHGDSLRRSDAYLMRGRILAALNKHDPEAEVSFRRAIASLANSAHIGIRVSAHLTLIGHLLTIGKVEDCAQELEQVRHLSSLANATYDPYPAYT